MISVEAGAAAEAAAGAQQEGHSALQDASRPKPSLEPSLKPSLASSLVAEPERSLDPDDLQAWETLRADAHRILDDTLDRMQTVGAQPAWQPMPAETQAAIDDAPAPQGERPLAEVYTTVANRILPYTSGNRHPRAWGWVRGQGTPVAMLADMIASAANAHVGGGFTAPVHVEETVLRWLAEALEMRAPRAPNTPVLKAEADKDATSPSGILTSGATMANLLGLAVARAAKAGFDVREQGLAGRPRMVLYGSSEAHGWAQKAVELLGLGRRSLRLIPADADGRIQVALLREQVRLDRERGEVPFAVIANAGTVNTGAFDDLLAVRAFCTEQDLWMHVDGAFGALLKLAPAHRALVDGLEHADSVAFDLHKWMYLPFETGCLLVRDRTAHHAAFAAEAAYMERGTRGMLAGNLSFSDRGIESSRGFKALRVWMQLSVYGLVRHGALIAQNMAQAEALEQQIRAHAELEMLAPRAANIICFRYRRLTPHASVSIDDSAPDALDTLNRRIVLMLQQSGSFVVSGTTLAQGAFALRVSITNHRSRLADFTALVEAVVAAGRACSAA